MQCCQIFYGLSPTDLQLLCRHPLIQSLISVFARLVTVRAGDVVDFLSGIAIGSQTGLEVVLNVWLENSNVFSGYSEIRQKYIYVES